MEEMTRRGFLGAAGALGVAGAAQAALGGAQAQASDEAAQVPVDVMTPADIEARGGSSMPLEELNRRRRELIDSKTQDWQCADGSVVPNVYVRLRTLFNTYGMGFGNDLTDECFSFWMTMFTEDEAQAYLDAPMGAFFTMLDYVEKTGRDYDESFNMWDSFAQRGVAYAVTRGGARYYRQIAFLQGANEYTQRRYETDGLPYILEFSAASTPDVSNRALYSASSFYYAIPCDRSIVEGELPAHDDYEQIVRSNTVFALMPCFCRTGALIASGQEFPGYDADLSGLRLETADQPIETCLCIGEMAEYVLSQGMGRQLDQDGALEVLRRSVDLGYILESCHSQTHEIICSCHSSTCGHLKIYTAFDPETLATSNVIPNVSDFDLVYDADACLACGACAQRCPMGAIVLNDEGLPEVNAYCFRCGQCCMVCPAQARKLAAKPEQTRGILPFGELEDDNMKAAYRFEHGLIW